MRLRTDFWVAAYLRRCAVADVPVYLRRRGAPEAGAVIVKVDRLDGSAALFGLLTAPEADGARRFAPLHTGETIGGADAEERLARETGYDADVWIVEIESRAGCHFLDEA